MEHGACGKSSTFLLSIPNTVNMLKMLKHVKAKANLSDSITL
jgi:hypothetical protein